MVEVVLDFGRRLDERDSHALTQVEHTVVAVRQRRARPGQVRDPQSHVPERTLLTRSFGVEQR